MKRMEKYSRRDKGGHEALAENILRKKRENKRECQGSDLEI